MFKIKAWAENNRPKKHRSVAVFILMLTIVATATNKSPETNQTTFPRKASLAQNLELRVYRDMRLLFIEPLKAGTEIDLISESSANKFLANYKGEIFQINTLDTTEGTPTKDMDAPGPDPTSDIPPEIVWVIGSESYKNPRIVKEFPKSAMVRHEGGVSFVDKDLVPGRETGSVGMETETAENTNSETTLKSQCSGTTTLLKVENFMKLPKEVISKDISLWNTEQKILTQANQNKELGKLCNYDYLGLPDIIKDASLNEQLPQLSKISIEEEFRKKGIKGRQQEAKGCGVAALSTTLEFLLKKENPEIEVPWNKTKGLVLKYPDAMGRIGFAYSMGPEIISAYGIPTNNGIEKRSIRIRGLYKFFILNRDEFPNEKINQNNFSFQTRTIEDLVKNELINKRPVLAGVSTGPHEKKGDSIGPNYGKANYPHAVIIVGYEKLYNNSSPYRFRILNSWGDQWGEDGYGWLYPSKISGLYSIELL